MSFTILRVVQMIAIQTVSAGLSMECRASFQDVSVFDMLRAHDSLKGCDCGELRYVGWCAASMTLL